MSQCRPWNMPGYLYNVTFDIFDRREVLEPAVPRSAAKEEERSIRRVCLSTTVEHCIEALGVEHRELCTGAELLVREVPIENLYSKILVTPDILFKKGYVPDALETKEHWYLAPVKMITCRYTIVDFIAEYDIAWSCVKVKDMLSIAAKYGIQPSELHKFTSSKDIYEYCMEIFHKSKNYDFEDDFYDDVDELPWAQRLKVSKLSLERIA